MLLRTFFVRTDKDPSSFLLYDFIVGIPAKVYIAIAEIKRRIGLQEI